MEYNKISIIYKKVFLIGIDCKVMERENFVMDLRFLNTFNIIVEEGSFTKAAEVLNYTQSTITFHVDKIEKELGVQLFEKVGRQMQLTEAGRELVPYVRNVIQSVYQLKNFHSIAEECTGTIRIAAPETLLCYHLPEILKEFRKKVPKVKIVLESMNSLSVLKAIYDNKIDVGIFYELPDMENRACVVPYRDFSLALFAAPEIKARYYDFITPGQEFEDLSCVCQPQTGSVRKRFDQYLRVKNIRIGKIIQIRSTQTIKNLVKSGLGVCCLPKFTIDEDSDTGFLEEIPVDRNLTPIRSVYGYHKDKWISAPVKVFLSLLQGRSTIN